MVPGGNKAMRVIAGSARRVRLEIASGSRTRPLLEVARGALFNFLGDGLAGARVLDLYAGSGALGIEAMSRGAASCLFVERDRRAVRVLLGNLERCGMRERAEVMPRPVRVALSRLRAESRFSLVFVDPPFDDVATWERSPDGIAVTRAAVRLLAPGGNIVFRVPSDQAALSSWRTLPLTWERVHGRSRICVYAPAAMEAGAHG